MAYTDDWESLMNGVFGAGGRVKFGSGAVQPDTKAKTGGLPDLNAALLEQQKQAEKLSGIRGEVSDIAWGNQIRSYVMEPYTLVKDHRTGAEVSNVDAVMDGKIDPFINAYLKWIALKK